MPYYDSEDSIRDAQEVAENLQNLGELLGEFGDRVERWSANFAGRNSQTNHYGPINIDDSNAANGPHFGRRVEIGNVYVNNVGYNGIPVYQGGSDFTNGRRRPARNSSRSSAKPTPSNPASRSGHGDTLPKGKNGSQGQSQGDTFDFNSNNTRGPPRVVNRFASRPIVTGGRTMIGNRISIVDGTVNISLLNPNGYPPSPGNDTWDSPEYSSASLREMEGKMGRMSMQMGDLGNKMNAWGADQISVGQEMDALGQEMRALNMMMEEERSNIARNASSTQGKNSSYSTGYDERAFTSGGAEPFCHTSTSHFTSRPGNSTRTSRVFYVDREGGFHTLEEVSSNVSTNNKSQDTRAPNDTLKPESSTRRSKGNHFASFSFGDEPDLSENQSASSRPTFHFNNSFSVGGEVVPGQYFDSNGQDLNFGSSKSSRQKPASGKSSILRRGGKAKRKNVSFDFGRKTGSTNTKKDDLGRGLLNAGSSSSVNYMPATVQDEEEDKDDDEFDYEVVDQKDFM